MDTLLKNFKLYQLKYKYANNGALCVAIVAKTAEEIHKFYTNEGYDVISIEIIEKLDSYKCKQCGEYEIYLLDCMEFSVYCYCDCGE